MIRTLILASLLCASLYSNATGETPASKESSVSSSKKSFGTRYTIHLDNTINKNNAVDSVFVILDKFDRSGAGVVKKVFYPDSNNQVIVEDLPAGKYYAEVYVLGLYKKHFSTIIYTKASRKNKVTLPLDYNDAYTPGNVKIPAEDTSMFAYNKSYNK
jgi:hypothetical protein